MYIYGTSFSPLSYTSFFSPLTSFLPSPHILSPDTVNSILFLPLLPLPSFLSSFIPSSISLPPFLPPLLPSPIPYLYTLLPFHPSPSLPSFLYPFPSIHVPTRSSISLPSSISLTLSSFFPLPPLSSPPIMHSNRSQCLLENTNRKHIHQCRKWYID